MLRFTVLGPVAIHRDGQPLPFARAQRRGLLAYLLLNANRLVTTDLLVNALWGECEPDSARAQIHAGISAIRTMLRQADDSVRLIGGTGYRLMIDSGRLDLLELDEALAAGRRHLAAGDPDNAVDVLRRALALWTGPVLAGVSGVFVEGARIRLEEKRLSTTEDLVEAELRRGDYGEVIDRLAPLVDEHPVRERLHSQLMVALHRHGRRSDALAVYRRLGHALSKDQGLDPSPALRELHAAILREDVGGEPGPNLRRSVDVPVQLPANVPGFVGRVGELRRLDSIFFGSETAGHAAVIVGPPGVGKTGLAVHWAHRVRNRFPDGQLYLDLQGFSKKRTVDPHLALERLLASMGVPSAGLPRDLDQRANLYRERLAPHRMLIMLDNARDSSQVRHLLPGVGDSRVIVTSRRRLDGLVASDGVALAPLPEPEACQLLATLGTGGADAPGLAELSRLCDGLPLALRIAAARLSADPNLTPAALARMLSGEGERLARLAVEEGDLAVRAAFDSSYAVLPADAARLFRLAGLAPGPTISAEVGAALAGCRTEVAGRLLDTLVTANVVDRAAPDRYRLHDLLRVFARDRAELTESAADRDAAVRRVLRWYVTAGRAAESMIRPTSQRDPRIEGLPAFPGLPDPPALTSYQESLAWLDQEDANLRAAVHAADDHGWHDLTWPLVHAQYYVLGMRAERSVWEDMSRRALRAAQRDHHLPAQALFLNGLAVARAQQQDFAGASRWFEQAVEIQRRVGDEAGLIRTLSNLAGLYGDRGDYADAVDRLSDVVCLLRSADDRSMLVVALNNLGHNLVRLGRPEEAVPYLGEAAILAAAAEDRRSGSYTAGFLGEAYVHLGRAHDAVAQYREAVGLAAAVGERGVQARWLVALGDSLDRLGEQAEARGCWRTALDIYRHLGDVEAEDLEKRLVGDRQVT
jgi:DNA-binding SARP family transcriptional activator/tetratricopeptide (TPR) repeat protein